MSAGAHVGVLGAGAWGTALAIAAWRAGAHTTLWARDPALAAAISATGENARALPGVRLDPAIAATGDLDDLARCDVVLAAVPAQHLRAMLATLAGRLNPGAVVGIAAKGVERGTLATVDQIAAQALPNHAAAIVTGPSFARDVALGLPTAIVVAGTTAVAPIVAALRGPTFRPYASVDPIGAAVGGAVKNVIAIACGVAMGRELGDNARAALVTRGLAETMRLGLALGGRAETLAGLAGLGDLVLTCTGQQSRNLSLGLAIGRGRSAASVLAERHSVAEGASTAAAVTALAARLGVAMPICQAVAAVVAGEAEVDETIAALLSRPLQSEF